MFLKGCKIPILKKSSWHGFSQWPVDGEIYPCKMDCAFFALQEKIDDPPTECKPKLSFLKQLLLATDFKKNICKFFKNKLLT